MLTKRDLASQLSIYANDDAVILEARMILADHYDYSGRVYWAQNALESDDFARAIPECLEYLDASNAR